MTDRNQPFDPREVEKQVDQLSSTSGETCGTSSPDQRFLHDLRLILAAGEDEPQTAADEHFLNSAWARISFSGHLTQDTMQRANPLAHHRRFTVMSTLPSTPEQTIKRHSSFKRRLTTLAAAIIAFTLAGALVMFTLASHVQQPNPGTGAPQHPTATRNSQHASSYTYYQAGQMPVYSLQWSPDGTRIISANENVTSWDAFSGTHKITYTSSSAPKPQILFTRLSPDGKTLAVWNIGQIDLYDVASGKHLSTLSYPFAQTPGVKYNLPSLSPYLSWSADGASIRALAGFPASNSSRTNKLVTFTVATGAHQDVALGLTGLLDRVAWSPNGKYVAVGRTSEGSVSVLNVANGQVVSTLHAGSPIETIPLGWSSDSSKLAADFGNNSGLYIWDAVTAKKVVTYQGGTEPAWSPNGKYIAVIYHASIVILNASTGKVVQTYTNPASSSYATVAWSPDGRSIAAGGNRVNGQGGTVTVWNVSF